MFSQSKICDAISLSYTSTVVIIFDKCYISDDIIIITESDYELIERVIARCFSDVREYYADYEIILKIIDFAHTLWLDTIKSILYERISLQYFYSMYNDYLNKVIMKMIKWNNMLELETKEERK